MVEQLQESSFISDLPSVPFNNLDELPAIPAIYFALDDTKIVWYVGRAKNLKKLFYSRHKREKEFRENNVCNIAYLQVKEKN
jgi:excinuclease UvrABC nuclease subunit